MTQPYLVILSCGRGGTKYASEVFAALGLDVGHERQGRDGVVAGGLAAGDDHLPAPYCPVRWSELPEPRVIVHQVREPLATIGSLQTVTDRSWAWIRSACPEIVAEPLVARCAAYWDLWNDRIESMTWLRYRVETMIEALPWLLSLLQRSDVDILAVADVPTTINTRRWRYEPVTWATLTEADVSLAGRVRDRGRNYGYGSWALESVDGV